MNGAEFAARYAFPPNSRGYCGSPGFRKTLRSYLDGHGNERSLEEQIRGFPVHHAYLSLIARENGLEPFDKEVVEAFWIGNSLLESVRLPALRSFIKKDLLTRSARSKSLAQNLPAGILPHHSFNALYINFVTAKAKRSIENYDACCITAGKVLGIGPSLLVDRFSIGWKNGFVLGRKTCSVALSRSGICFLEDVKKGDLVSVHWGMAVEKLSKKRCDSLLRYTERNMLACNAASSRR